MKKRFVCVLLTLVMLVSLVPATALTASAASLKTSEAAITILKKLATFQSKCYWVNGTSEFRIGYGTICNAEGHEVEYDKDTGAVTEGSDCAHHTVTQVQADQALRKVLVEVDAKVNSFASANGLNLSQCQHDALVLFTFDVGDAWMSGSGVVKSAITSNASTTQLLKAMDDWANRDDDIRRRTIEVNMYKNGVYSDVQPSSFGYVTYDANGGLMAQGSTYGMLYDTASSVEHIPSPVKDGSLFMGWYKDSANGEWMPTLTKSCDGKTLYAAWQPKAVSHNSKAEEFHTASYELKKSQLASGAMHVTPVAESKVVDYTKDNTSLKVNADFIDADGNRWCRLDTNNLWVLLGTAKTNTNYTGAKLDVTVTVTNAYVNRRASDSAGSALTGSYKAGDKLKIVATNEAKTWGQVEENGVTVGWVALMYTDWSTVYDGSAASDANNTARIATATVTCQGYLNVRRDPGVGNKIVGAYAKNTTVDIFEIRTVNGHRWGRTASGWICLTYTRVTMLTNQTISDQGAMDYAFEVKVVGGVIEVRSEAGFSASRTGDRISTETTGVKVTNLATADGVTWAKAHWTVQETGTDGKTKTVAKTGWAPMYNTLGPYVQIVPTKFTVVSDTLNIRKNPGSSSEFVFKLTKGVEVEVQEISLLGEEIWGRIEGYVNESVSYDGWINLASNYAKRSSQVTIEEGSTNSDAIGTGTVINADNVRIRMTGALYGQPLGSIKRGTKVAVLEEKDGWYKIDYDVDNDPSTDSWIYGTYLEVKMGVVEGGTTSGTTGSTGGTVQTTNGTGTGIIANTYTGVNVRSGAGIGNAVVGKLLNGTQVEILEVKTVGTGKWGRVSQGWICMDYVTMISYSDIPSGSQSTESTGNGTAVDSFDNAEKTTTTAVYTGEMTADAKVCKTANPNLSDAENKIRTVTAGENITIYELMAVTQEIYTGESEDAADNDVETVVKQTTYWARINDGWVQNPADCIKLNALDEKTHTVTGSTTLNVRADAGVTNEKLDILKKGDQVPVTELKIVQENKTVTVWGRVETPDGFIGYCDLSYMSEGALYEKAPEQETKPTTPAPVIGSTGNTGDGGFVGSDGAKYKGKVINTNSLNVRVTASTGAAKATTLKGGANLSIYETKISDDMAWGRCDAGWVYLYYVDLTPTSGSAIDARVVFTDNTVIYSGSDGATATGSTYKRMAVIDIYEYVGNMARTDDGWVSTGDLL